MISSRVLAFLSLILIFSIGNAQDIRGKWMQIRIPNSMNYPLVNIIEIRSDSIFAFDFDKLYEKGKTKILGKNTLVLNDSLIVDFKFIGDNILEQKSVNDVNVEHPVKFVRLLPTKDQDNQVDSLYNKSFSIHFAHEKMKFVLGEKKAKGDAIIMDNPSIVTDHIIIEKVQKTYFLCFYLLEKLSYAFPIKEIDSDTLIIYGIPNSENEVVARRVN